MENDSKKPIVRKKDNLKYFIVVTLDDKDKPAVLINFAKNCMQNDNRRCGLIEVAKGNYQEDIEKDAFVWHQENYQHDDDEHMHARGQLTFVEEGYQYFHTGKSIYLVPQNHVVWIPSNLKHKTSSESTAVNLMVLLFKPILSHDFYNQVHVFPCPPVLREMLRYARKWNRLLETDQEEQVFLHALLNSLPNFCEDNEALQIPVPADPRLKTVCNYIHTNYAEGLNIELFASFANMSPRNLQRIFSKETGITIQKYVQLVRIIKSMALIDSKLYTLSEIAFKIGYQSLAAFRASYSSILKKRPRSLKSSGRL